MHLSALDATDVPDRVEKLREQLDLKVSDVQLCDLLTQVEGWIDFSKHCRTLAGRRGRAVEFDRALLIALIAEVAILV